MNLLLSFLCLGNHHSLQLKMVSMFFPSVFIVLTFCLTLQDDIAMWSEMINRVRHEISEKAGECLLVMHVSCVN